MARKKAAEREPNHERWLVTYADLITLLLIFFIVMYSMSKIDSERFQAMAESLSISLGGTPLDIADRPQGPSLITSGSEPQLTPEELEQMSIEGIKAKLDSFAEDNNIDAQLVSQVEERGLVISIQDTLLFESGSDALNPRARQILNQISTVLAASPNYIRVEGHTDNLPISTVKFPSNWELSVLRATNVVHILAEQGVSLHRLSAVGYGENRPVAANTTAEGRSKNRRVDMVVLRTAFQAVEPGRDNEANASTSSGGSTAGSSGIIDLTDQMNQH